MMIDLRAGAPVPGSMDVTWNAGLRGRREPPIQVHHYDEHTVILRQSKAVSYEAPFLYLLFGNRRAVLFDTGATADPAKFPLRAVVDELVDAWLERHHRDGYELLVAHTHGHNDHVAADAQFAGRPGTTVVGRDLAAVRGQFGFTRAWPDEQVALDLGGRVLELIGSPGHHPAAITVYDPWTAILLTGDTVLPGRLYVADFGAFLASLDRMLTLVAGRPVAHVLGCHVEMTLKPGRDFPIGARRQPGERPLQMSQAQLTAVRCAAASVASDRGVHRFDDFIIYNEPSKAAQARLLARGLARKIIPIRARS